MKKSRFPDSQIMDATKRVEAGLAVPEVCASSRYSLTQVLGNVCLGSKTGIRE